MCENDPKMIHYGRETFGTRLFIASVRWSIYPLGGTFGYLKIFLRLLLGAEATLGFGYAGEAKFLNPWLGFALGMAG